MCLWSQLWLVDGVLYTLQPFHRQTNTWRADRDEDRSWCERSEQTHEEKKTRREGENMEDNVGWQSEINQQPRQRQWKLLKLCLYRSQNLKSILMTLKYSLQAEELRVFCHCLRLIQENQHVTNHRMHFWGRKHFSDSKLLSTGVNCVTVGDGCMLR